MASNFKVGDKVKCIYDDNYANNPFGQISSPYCGKEGVVNEVDDSGYKYPYHVDFSGIRSTWCSAEELELIKSNNISDMSLIAKFKLALKGEPRKSFIKKGVLNSDESFTTDGKDLFLAFLLSKYESDFDKEVVSKIELDEETE